MKKGGRFVRVGHREARSQKDRQSVKEAAPAGRAAPAKLQFFISLEDEVGWGFSARTKSRIWWAGLAYRKTSRLKTGCLLKRLNRRSQKIEGFNFDARKHLLEYDDVLNQRKILMTGEEKILYGENDFVLKNWKVSLPINERHWSFGKKSGVRRRKFFHKAMRDADVAGNRYALGGAFGSAMDYMASSVRLRAYGQKDQLVEYKNEGRGLFIRMESSPGTTPSPKWLWRLAGKRLSPNKSAGFGIHNSGPGW